MANTAITTDESISLLAEHLNIDVKDLKKASEDRREKARMERLAAQIEAEKQAEIRRIEKGRKNLREAWKDGNIFVRIDGKLKSKPCDICTEGTPNLDGVISQATKIRQRLVNGFKGIDGTCGMGRTAGMIVSDVTCTCGKTHKIEVFITCNKTD